MFGAFSTLSFSAVSLALNPLEADSGGATADTTDITADNVS